MLWWGLSELHFLRGSVRHAFTDEVTSKLLFKRWVSILQVEKEADGARAGPREQHLQSIVRKRARLVIGSVFMVVGSWCQRKMKKMKIGLDIRVLYAILKVWMLSHRTGCWNHVKFKKKKWHDSLHVLETISTLEFWDGSIMRSKIDTWEMNRQDNIKNFL